MKHRPRYRVVKDGKENGGMSKINFKQALQSLHSGNLELKPYVVLAGQGKIFPKTSVTDNTDYQTAQIEMEYEGLFRDVLYLSYGEGDIIGKRMFENLSDKNLSLCELGIEISGLTYNKDPKDDYFYHAENARLYNVMTLPIDYVRSEDEVDNSAFDFTVDTYWADPGTVGERIGASPYQPFPAVLISNYGTNLGLVHGTLSQDVFFHNYKVHHENNTMILDALSSFKAIDALEIVPNRVLVDEWYLGYTEHAENIEKIFEKYTEVLRTKLPPSYGQKDLNRHALVWGSWNDGIWRGVTEDLLLTEARFLKEHFPTVKWFQLDDGYAVYAETADVNVGSTGLSVAYEGEDGIDHEKFPNGMSHYTAQVRQLGLIPAIWIGALCPIDRKLYQEHPEWFADYSYRIEESQPLDVSQPEVREYVQSAFETLTRKYGFESVKLDFWSYAFEDSHDLYRYKEHSGYEYRRWLLSVLRSCLPRDGYLQSGCDISLGNPFLGEFFTNHRYGDDIGEGTWNSIKFTFRLGTACLANHIGDLLIPNSDGIGLLPGLERKEAMFYINYCIVTHSMVEIAGKLSQVTDQDEIRLLQKAACNPNNGQDVHFVDYDYRNHQEKLPEIMYFNTPHFSRIEGGQGLPIKTFGLFNLNDEDKAYTIHLKAMGLEEGTYILTDVWSGKQYRCDGVYKETVEAHGSRLYAISHEAGMQLYDANIRIQSIQLAEDVMMLETDYAMTDAELLLQAVPSKLYYNDEEIVFTVLDNAAIRFDLPGKGVLKIEWV